MCMDAVSPHPGPIAHRPSLIAHRPLRLAAEGGHEEELLEAREKPQTYGSLEAWGVAGVDVGSGPVFDTRLPSAAIHHLG